MSDYVILMGSEDVARAGNQMEQAANSIQQSANQIEFALGRFIIRLEELLRELEGSEE